MLVSRLSLARHCSGLRSLFARSECLFLRDCVLKLVDTYPMFSAIDKVPFLTCNCFFICSFQAVTLNSWKIVTLLRLSPVTPYNVLNYALSLTRIKFWDYAWSSAVGMVPSTILFAYIGTAAKNIADIVNNQNKYLAT